MNPNVRKIRGFYIGSRYSNEYDSGDNFTKECAEYWASLAHDAFIEHLFIKSVREMDGVERHIQFVVENLVSSRNNVDVNSEQWLSTWSYIAHEMSKWVTISECLPPEVLYSYNDGVGYEYGGVSLIGRKYSLTNQHEYDAAWLVEAESYQRTFEICKECLDDDPDCELLHHYRGDIGQMVSDFHYRLYCMTVNGTPRLWRGEISDRTEVLYRFARYLYIRACHHMHIQPKD